MTVGFDVCHSPKNKNKSYGAFVAIWGKVVSTGLVGVNLVLITSLHLEIS